METLSPVLVLCQGNLSQVDSPHKGTIIQSFEIFFAGSLNKLLNKQSSYRWFQTPWQSYDITVMFTRLICQSNECRHDIVNTCLLIGLWLQAWHFIKWLLESLILYQHHWIIIHLWYLFSKQLQTNSPRTISASGGIVVLVIIGSDNGLVPNRHQAIIWTNAD